MIAMVFWVDPIILIYSYWNVSMQLSGGSGWLLSCRFCLLGCLGWFPVYYYADAKVFQSSL